MTPSLECWSPMPREQIGRIRTMSTYLPQKPDDELPDSSFPYGAPALAVDA